MADDEMPEECYGCHAMDVKLTYYKPYLVTEEGDWLCQFCELTTKNERLDPVIGFIARALHVLEDKLKKGKRR